MSETPPLSQASPEVDRFLASLDHPMANDIAGLREAILVSNPAITEHIKWKAPSFSYEGDDRVTFRLPPKGGLQLIFHRGVAVKDATGFRFADESGLLQWVAPDRATVTVADAEEVRTRQGAIVDLVNRWMRETAAGQGSSVSS